MRRLPSSHEWPATLFALGLIIVASVPARGGDFSVFRAAATYATAIEPNQLLGEWKDDSWQRIVWRVQPGRDPRELVITHYLEHGSLERMRGIVVHTESQDDYLDMIPDGVARQTGDQPIPHIVIKLKMTRTDAVSIGTPRRVRKEFQGKLAKSYHKLTLIPSRASRLMELTQGSTTISTTLASQGPLSVILITTSDELAKFLREHGNDSTLWQSELKAKSLAQRIEQESEK